MESRALGKGLSALIPEKQSVARTDSIQTIKISEIKENSLQPRSNYDEAKLSELITSIKDKGVLQPILVRQKGSGYEVIAGERRLRAARSLNLQEVPVVIKSVSDEEALVLALVENIQREELNAIEEAQAFHRLITEFKFTQDSVAQSVGKDRSTVGNTIRLLKLPEEIQKSVSNGLLSEGHARALLSVDNPIEQKKIYELAVNKKLSVREVENLVKFDGYGTLRRAKRKSSSKDSYLISLEDELQRVLGTKVRVLAQKKRGKILIEYYSLEDLERIRGIIKK